LPDDAESRLPIIAGWIETILHLELTGWYKGYHTC